MNLDPNETLGLIDDWVYNARELRYYMNRVKLYSQAETLCLLGLIEEGIWGSELYDSFNLAHPGRTKAAIKTKTYLLAKKNWTGSDSHHR